MTTNPQPAPALDRLFSSLRRIPVSRSNNRVIAGVCSGVAERLGVSPAIVRVGAVLLAIFGFGVTLYLLAWLLLPGPDGRIRLEQALRGGDAASIVLLVITVLNVIPAAMFRPQMPWLALLVIGGVGFAILRNRSACHNRSQPVPPAQPGPTGAGGTPQDAPRS